MSEDDLGEVIARGYDRAADRYEALESKEHPWPRLKRVTGLIGALADGSHVLDLGCGNGVPATREIAKRHTVTGVDLSSEQIRRARANVPQATFRCADVREVEFPAEEFDAIVALYLIDNVPAADYARLFQNLAKWLKPGGRILLSAEPGNDDGRLYQWLDVPMFINTVPTRVIVDALEEASLHVVDISVESQLEGGRPIEYAWLVAERHTS
jgi:cyclopropane fatty-acyl-phospholipid synthase-like methyltransferase